MECKTALYDCHVRWGGKMVPFAGYLLPVQYQSSGVIAEHMAVRNKAGIFDVSHMGEVLYSGKDALANLNEILTNDYTNLAIGAVRYGMMCNEQGGILDDLIVYKLGEERYMVVVNASNREKDVAWMKNHIFGEVVFEDISDTLSQIALQGPNAPSILAKVADSSSIPTKYYTCIEKAMAGDIPCIISQTGYTGEDGYELYMSNEDAPKMWELLLDAGASEGLIPCGLGARDTLRLEAAMPLYGHEMDESINPLEAGLTYGVKLNKPSFIGRDALLAHRQPSRKRVGLMVTGRGIVREHENVYAGEKQVGVTTSGTHCPYVGHAVAMAYLQIPYTSVGTQVQVEVRGRRIDAEVVPLPFYKKNKPIDK